PAAAGATGTGHGMSRRGALHRARGRRLVRQAVLTGWLRRGSIPAHAGPVGRGAGMRGGPEAMDGPALDRCACNGDVLVAEVTGLRAGDRQGPSVETGVSSCASGGRSRISSSGVPGGLGPTARRGRRGLRAVPGGAAPARSAGNGRRPLTRVRVLGPGDHGRGGGRVLHGTPDVVSRAG